MGKVRKDLAAPNDCAKPYARDSLCVTSNGPQSSELPGEGEAAIKSRQLNEGDVARTRLVGI